MFVIKKKIIFTVALSILIAFSGNSIARELTIADLAKSQKQLIHAKLKAELFKIQQAQRDAAKKTEKKEEKTPVSLAAPVNSQSSTISNQPAKATDEIMLVAVYGVGDNLIADIVANGAVLSVKQNDMVDGWKVKLIHPTRLVMSKKGKVKDFMLSVKKTDYDPSMNQQNYAPLMPPQNYAPTPSLGM